MRGTAHARACQTTWRVIYEERCSNSSCFVCNLRSVELTNSVPQVTAPARVVVHLRRNYCSTAHEAAAKVHHWLPVSRDSLHELQMCSCKHVQCGICSHKTPLPSPSCQVLSCCSLLIPQDQANVGVVHRVAAEREDGMLGAEAKVMNAAVSQTCIAARRHIGHHPADTRSTNMCVCPSNASHRMTMAGTAPYACMVLLGQPCCQQESLLVTWRRQHGHQEWARF